MIINNLHHFFFFKNFYVKFDAMFRYLAI